MATNTLIIKDGNGSQSALATLSSSYGLIPEHSITGAVNVTASSANPVYITGAVNIAQPVTVDVTVGDLINITSSQGNPVAVTGTINVNNIPAVQSVTGTVNVNNIPAVQTVTASLLNPIGAKLSYAEYGLSIGTALVVKTTGSSDSDRTWVTGNLHIDNYSLNVTSSNNSPILVTGSVTTNASVTVNDGLKVELSGANVRAISGSSTNTYLQVQLASVATSSIRRTYAPTNPQGGNCGFAAYFDWSTIQSGSVCLASSSNDRKSLTIFNPSGEDLFISIGNLNNYPITNGLCISNTSSVSADYSFILYPSGTYFAESYNVGMFHGGYMVSSSNGRNRIFVTETY